MKLSGFFCPQTKLPLTVSADGTFLIRSDDRRYPVVDGIPALLADDPDRNIVSKDQEYYHARAAEYDRGNDVMFRMLRSEEAPTRSRMAGLLNAGPGKHVLEVGCGTCRDTIHLLQGGATVDASDLSQEMIVIGRNRLAAAHADMSRVRLFRASAMALPFPDDHFDGVFHFGGMNLFPDVEAALAEMARVVKPGGRVVAGDEGIGSWLANTDFARILENSNPLFQHRAPLDKIPVLARNVSCQWVLNGSFYLIAFDVGSGEPELDLDVQFPGRRGGSHRTRYYGKLEGVSPALRDEVANAAASKGVSMVDWLEDALRDALKGGK